MSQGALICDHRPQTAQMLNLRQRIRLGGCRLAYAEQPKPEGFAQAFLVGADFVGKDRVPGVGRQHLLRAPLAGDAGARTRPRSRRYGFRVSGARRAPLCEEPAPLSNWAMTGLYFFDHEVARCAREVKPPWRSEPEITDVNARYLVAGTLNVERMGRGFAWPDRVTFESLIDAATFVQTSRSVRE